MANIANVVRQNLLSINQLQNDSISVDSRLSSLEDKVNNLTELLNTYLTSNQVQVAEAPVAKAPVAEAPVAEEGNLNLEVQ